MTEPTPPSDDAVAEALAGRYPVVRLLGRGGMGAVYLARDVALQRLVAVKVLLPEFAADPERRELFRREALANARLAHPNIVPVYAVGEAHGMPYLVMRYVAGHSLAFRLWRGQPLAVVEVCRILAELASALHFAHRQNVVHRDIKPENVLLDKEAECTMLTDFGIARFGSLDAISMSEAQAERGMVRGTVQYMSPEQAAGEWEIDGRSDLYALGVLGYAMLSGRLPFEGTSFAQIAAMHASATPVPIPQLNPDVPPAVVEVIARCLEKRPDDRWSDGAALRGALVEAGLRPDARAAVGRGGGGFLSRVTPWTPWGKQRKRG